MRILNVCSNTVFLLQRNQRIKLTSYSICGKAVLDELHKLDTARSGMSRSILVYESPRHARDRRSVSASFEGFHGQLRIRADRAGLQLAADPASM